MKQGASANCESSLFFDIFIRRIQMLFIFERIFRKSVLHFSFKAGSIGGFRKLKKERIRNGYLPVISSSLAAITFLFNNLPRTLLHALAAAGTFLIIYMSHIPFHGNSACLAVFHTFHTADASGFTWHRG